MTEKVNGTECDLGQFVSKSDSTGEFLHLNNPANGEPLFNKDGEPVGIYVLGKDSDAFRNAQREISNRRLSRRGNTNITAERIESEANEVLAKCTVSWNIIYNGDALECSLKNVKQVYNELPWVKEQVDEFVAERANFLGK